MARQKPRQREATLLPPQMVQELLSLKGPSERNAKAMQRVMKPEHQLPFRSLSKMPTTSDQPTSNASSKTKAQ